MGKLCKQCGIEKEREEFYRLTGSQYKESWDCRDSFCKLCRNGYQTNRRQYIKKQAVEYLGGQCVDCNLRDDPCVYDFHHLDPDKKDLTIGKSSKSFEKLKFELDKTVLLCSNCHRKRHYCEAV